MPLLRGGRERTQGYFSGNEEELVSWISKAIRASAIVDLPLTMANGNLAKWSAV